MKKVISGFTCGTTKNLLLNTGAWFKNYNIDTDTFDTAVSSGKLLGATQGGGTFTATPTIRNLEIDGMPGNIKGGILIDNWVVTMQASIIEVSVQTFKDALGAAFVDDTSNANFTILQAKNFVDTADYIDNITWLGTLSGSDEPVIIQIFNALSTTGITLTTADKSQSVLPVTFQASSDQCSAGAGNDLNYAPFAIYYPKTMAKPSIKPIYDDQVTLEGTGLTGATVAAYGGTIPINTTTIVDISGNWNVSIPMQTTGTILHATQTKGGKTSEPTNITVLDNI